MDYTLAEQIFYVYIVRIICGFGILGNILNLTILARRTLSESPYTFLTAMTVSDLFVLITIAGVGVVRCGYCVLTAEQRYKGHVYEVYAFLPLANIAASTSTFITIAIAIERYIFVRFPLLAKKFCNRRSARILIVAMFMLSSTLNFSRFFLNQVTWNITLPQNKTSVSSYLEFRCDDFLSSSGNIIRCRLQGSYSVSQQHTQNDTATLVSKPSWINATSVMMLENDDPICWKNISEILPPKSDSCGECNIEDLDEDCSRLLISNLSTCGNKGTFRNCSNDPFPKIWFWNKELFRDCFNISFSNLYFCTNEEDLFLSYSKTGTILNFLCSSEYLEFSNTTLPLNISANATSVKPICLVATDSNDSINVTSDMAISSVRVEATSFGKWAMDGYQIVVAITESLSFVLLVSFNICLIIVLRRKHIKRQTIVASFRVARYSRRQRRDQQRLTMTLLAITCISAATTFTNIVNSHPVSSRLFSPTYSQFFGLLGNLTLLLSNTINFLLYALLNSRFRREFLLVYKVKLFKLFERKAHYSVRSGLENSTEIPLSITNSAI